MDADADTALKEWYTLLDAQGAYVTACQGGPRDEFDAAKRKYLDELKVYHQLNDKSPDKIQKIIQILKTGGDDDCRIALREELGMLKNRESVLEDANCKR